MFIKLSDGVEFPHRCHSLGPHRLWSTFTHSTGEVCVHWNNVVVVTCKLGVTGAGKFELLCCVGQLEGSVWVGRVWEQGTFSLQEVSYSLEKLPKTESQGSLPEAVQLLAGPRIGEKNKNKKKQQVLHWENSEQFIQQNVSFKHTL